MASTVAICDGCCDWRDASFLVPVCDVEMFCVVVCDRAAEQEPAAKQCVTKLGHIVFKHFLLNEIKLTFQSVAFCPDKDAGDCYKSRKIC